MPTASQTTNSILHTNPATARVLVALDVIALLLTNPFFHATIGQTLDGEMAQHLRRTPSTESAQKVLEKYINNSQCNVCAKGALTVAHVLRFNGLTAGQMGWNHIHEEDQLAEFPAWMMDEVEALFEGAVYGDLTNRIKDGNKNHQKIRAYRKKHNYYGLAPKDRLIQIMALLITNRGEFLVLPPRAGKPHRDSSGRFARK